MLSGRIEKRTLESQVVKTHENFNIEKKQNRTNLPIQIKGSSEPH